MATDLFKTYSRDRNSPPNYAQEIIIDDGAVVADVVLRVVSSQLIVVANEAGSVMVRFTGKRSAVLIPVAAGFNFFNMECDRILMGGENLARVVALGIDTNTFYVDATGIVRGFSSGFSQGFS